MGQIEFTVDYFMETEKDGNKSLESSEDRIMDAIKLVKSGDTILLKNLNKIVRNENELRNAIEEYAKK
jgi:hypothetical protein